MLTGQIGLVPLPPKTAADPTPGSWIARGIATVTDSPVFHCVLAVSEQAAVGAEPGGARLRPIDYYPGTVWSHFRLDPDQQDDIVRWALGHIGTPYNYLDDAAIGAALTLHKLRLPEPLWLERFLSNPAHLQCAQLVDMAYTVGGKHPIFADGRPFGAVYPGSFVPIWKANGWGFAD